MQWIDAITRRLLRGSDLQALEDTRRVLLFMMLTALGASLMLIFGLISLSSGRFLLAGILLPASMLGIINLVWLFRTRRYRQSALGMSFIVTLVSVLLLTSGGVEGTGLLWIFPLMAVSIFTAGFSAGFYIFSVFFGATLVMMFWPDTPLLNYEYSQAVKIRFVASLFLLGFVCLSVELVHSHSRTQVADLHSEIRLTAQTDALTQLPNRRYVMDQLLSVGRFVEPFSTGCVVLADIDRFKAINDQHGHDVGDVVLKAVAKFLASETRTDDVVVRWGGEEFLLVLPGITRALAERRMESVRQHIEEMNVLCHGARLRVTVSFGVTALISGELADTALKRADASLYRAKAEGRNRVVVG